LSYVGLTKYYVILIRTLTLQKLPSDQACTYAHWLYSQPNEAPPLHDHTFYELFWVVEGVGRHLINGEECPLEAGTLVLVRPTDAHGFTNLHGQPPLRFINMAFRPALWSSLKRRHPQLRGRWFDEPSHHAREHRLDRIRLERLRHLSADLDADQRDELTTEAFILSLLALLGRFTKQQEQGGPPAWLAEARRRMQEPRYFAGGTRAFARLAGCSPEHLAREVKRRYQLTPTDIVNEARLTHAASRLASSNLSILEIIAECGFENLGHFYKIFQVRYGTTPSRYRRQAELVGGHTTHLTPEHFR
jgi:AraC family transcriptional regulator, dual regulator of chb operon